VWAPELHRLDGIWHIYVAASDGYNRNHRAYVLVADTDDPQGSYTLHGPLETAGWAIDMTVLDHRGGRYALWSGWPDEQTPVQHLYLAAMASPTELAGPRVLLTSPFDYPWERIRDDGLEAINEGPQVLAYRGRTFVVFSCGSALLPSYKLGLLELVGDDPLDPACWHKSSQPLFTSTAETFGVGHGTFVQSPDRTEWWVAYHCKIGRRRSFKRVVQVQPMRWSDDGAPVLGAAIAAGVALAEPSGTTHRPRRESRVWDLCGLRRDFDYYGHQQLRAEGAVGLRLGVVPEQPVNAFRSGEKLVLRDGDYEDVRVTARLRVVQGDRAVGVLLRTTAPAVGVDAQRGYFAGWVARRQRLVVGRTDGVRWTPLGSARVAVEPGAELQLVFEAVGSQLRARLGDGQVVVADATYSRGSVGVRVVHTAIELAHLAAEVL